MRTRVNTSLLTQQEKVSEKPEVTLVISTENAKSTFINDVQLYSAQNTCTSRN